MAHIANIKPTTAWKTIETLISESIGEHGELVSGKSYTLHSNGGNCWIVQQSAEPTENFLGFKLCAGQDYTFTFDTEIYLQSTTGNDIDIEDAVSNGGSGSGMTAVHLVSDGEKIYKADDTTETALTYTEVKTLIEDLTKFVFLTNGNYEFVEKYKYTKMSGEDHDAIGFFGTTYLEGIPYLYRIAINELNSVITDEIPLQKRLTAGDNITITDNVISATDTKYTAGDGIEIDENNVIKNTRTSAEWGNITGTLSDQTDLNTALASKQDKLTAGNAINIEDDTVNVALFDSSKFTVVGNPTITDDGIASGFSTTSMANTSSYVFNPYSSSWSIKGYFITGEDISTPQIIISAKKASTGSPQKRLAVTIENATQFGWGISIDGVYWAGGYQSVNYSIKQNTRYYFNLSFNGTSIYNLAIGEESNIVSSPYTNTSVITESVDEGVRFGIEWKNMTHPFLGSIDLSKFSITVDGEEVFSGSQTVYQALASKQDKLDNITGYDATKTQVLKNVNGVLTWVDE